MTITLTFNGYGELKTFCQQILGQEPEKPKELTVEELNESAKATTEIINRAEKIEAEGKKETKKPEKEKKARKQRVVITEKIRQDTLDYLDGGMSVKETAELVGISPASVLRIMNVVQEKK